MRETYVYVCSMSCTGTPTHLPDSVASSRLPSLSGCRILHLVIGNDSKSFMSLIFNITIRFPLYDGTNTCIRHRRDYTWINELFMRFYACVKTKLSHDDVSFVFCSSILVNAYSVATDIKINSLAF